MLTFTKKISSKQITQWTHQLATLLHAHLPLTQALQLLTQTQTHHELQNLTHQIYQEIRQGMPLSHALQQFPHYFEQTYYQLIIAAEHTGTLAVILQRIADQRTLRQKIRAQQTRALIYPLLVLLVGCVVFILLLTLVVPQIARVFNQFNQALPGFTQFILLLAQFLQQHGFILILFILLASAGLITAYYYIPKVKLEMARLRWRCPGIGQLMQQAGCILFARTLATLLDAGIPLLTSLPISNQVITNVYVQQRLQAATLIISQGHSLSYALAQTEIFPHLALQMWQIGEHTGKLSTLLNDSAHYYQQQLNQLTEHIAQLIEPIFLIVLGLLIGSVVVAMYLPLFRLGLVLGA